MKKSLKRLVIDSATKFLYVALFEDVDCIDKYYKEGNNDHSVVLMIELERILVDNNVKISEIDEIIVGVGPGSYTGLRVGVVVAKMFGWNNNIPVYTVSSLALLASGSNKEGLVLAEVDARRGNSFLGLYEIKEEQISLLNKEQLTNLEEFKSSIKNDFTVVNIGEPNIEMILKSNILRRVKDIHSLNPNYLRITEAERNIQ